MRLTLRKQREFSGEKNMHDHYESFEKRLDESHDHFFLLVCNRPSEDLLTPAQKEILAAMTEKWKKTANDQDCQRMHIIYCDPNDKVNAPKFRVLNQASEYSLIYIIGHCKQGSRYIRSDPIYQKAKKSTLGRVRFPYHFFADIFFHHLNKNMILARRYDSSYIDNYQLNSLNRRLIINVPACFSATDKVDKDSQEINKSFVYRLLYHLLNAEADFLIKADVLGAQGYVAPVPTKPNLLDFATFLLTNKKSGEGEFHERYWLINENRLFSFIPRHNPSEIDYKPCFIISPSVSLSEVHESNIDVLQLTTKDGEQRLRTQIMGEKLLDFCNQAIEHSDVFGKTLTHKAKKIRDKIMIGEMKVEDMIAAGNEFERFFAAYRYLENQSSEKEETTIPSDLRNEILELINIYIKSREKEETSKKVGWNETLTEEKLYLARKLGDYVAVGKDVDTLLALLDDFRAFNREKERTKGKLLSGIFSKEGGSFGACLDKIESILVIYKTNVSKSEAPGSPSLNKGD
jgi:hypothetical protein